MDLLSLPVLALIIGITLGAAVLVWMVEQDALVKAIAMGALAGTFVYCGMGGADPGSPAPI